MPKRTRNDAGLASDEENNKRKKRKTSTTTPDTPSLPKDYPPPSKKEFTPNAFAKLAENEHRRYAPNSNKIGSAVLIEQAGETIAVQYQLPQVNDDVTPTVRPLVEIEAVEPFRGIERFRAKTPDGGTPMYAKRFVFGNVGDKSGAQPIRIACFSPSPEAGKPPFWGSIKPTPLFSEKLTKKAKKELEKELKEIKPVTKGGEALVIQHASVPQRDLMKTRTPDQNTVMGESARDAYEHFFEKMSSELHPEMKKRLKRAFSADIKDSFSVNSYRPEWLHAKGWSLMPIDMNPQTQDNLGAAPKWTNTYMMVLERVVKWYAQNAPESLLTIKPQFEMLLDSELIKHIDFKVKIQIKERFVELTQSIDPFLAYPLFAKASDLAQTAAITDIILNDVTPASQQVVKGVKKAPQKEGNPASIQSKSSAFSLIKPSRGKESVTSVVVSTPPNASVKETTLVNRSENTPALIPSKVNGKRQPDNGNEATVRPAKIRRTNSSKKFSTQDQHDHSLVQVYTDAFTPDYDNPWRDPETISCTGSGFIIEESGKKYIVTNAHVAENTIFLQVRLGNDRHKKYEAKVKCVSYQCDLALLEVDDPEFNKLAVPVELGDMVNLRQKVMVAGFPMGGTELSLSEGIVSRIEVRSYCMSGQNLLQVQVSAAINPGNSGGPTFSGGRVIGVAFQGYDRQGLGYIIPIPILRHFITEALSDKQYRGFPTIPFITEELENQHERDFYNMGKRTGIRIKNVDNLSVAHQLLKPDDILIGINGLPISNEGTVDIPGIGKCIDFNHMTQSNFIGDTVTLKVLRKNIKDASTEELDIEVGLDTILGETEKVPVTEHDKMPTFYINSGVSFMPLTRNYMEGEGSVFEEMYFVEDGCSLPDAPKKNHDEQIVIINQILKCNDTQGYDKHTNTIVKEINGKPINNIRDVIAAMEGNKGARHVIRLASKSIIVIPNMSAHELKKILKTNRISHDRSADLVPKREGLYVDELELTQAGMHALFAHMGYPNTISGSIYNGTPTINLEALNKQGFMPVLTGVGADSVAGHWIMLIQGLKNQYYLFDPLGQASGRGYHDLLASQLPKDSNLAVIPNGEGLNRGLCGYWVASSGLRAQAELKKATPPDLSALGQTITNDMRVELADGGYEQINSWLTDAAAQFPGEPATSPIDARELRRASQSKLQKDKPVTTVLLSNSSKESNQKKATAPAKRSLKEGLYVDELELTQAGMHALFAHMGYPNTISGSIYNGTPTINGEALNKQGFMPVLTGVGARSVAGHWIMLIQGSKNQYYLFDPLGHSSGKGYQNILASQLPKGSNLAVIPNGEGLNRGLCGYWVASSGLRAHAELNKASPSDLRSLGKTITNEMRTELADGGYEQIKNWLSAAAEQFPGTPATSPVNARDLRRDAQSIVIKDKAEVTVAPTPLRSLALGLFGKSKEEKERGEPARKKRRTIVESSSEDDQASTAKESSAEASLPELPGVKNYRKALEELEERVKNRPQLDDEDDDASDYVNTSEEDDATETEGDDANMDTDDEPLSKRAQSSFSK